MGLKLLHGGAREDGILEDKVLGSAVLLESLQSSAHCFEDGVTLIDSFGEFFDLVLQSLDLLLPQNDSLAALITTSANHASLNLT